MTKYSAPFVNGDFDAVQRIQPQLSIRTRNDEGGGDKNGIIRVKLGAGEDGSGLVLSEGGTAASRGYVQIIARQTGSAQQPATTSITLRSEDGRQHVITP